MRKNLFAALLASLFVALSSAHAQSPTKSWPTTTPRAAGLDPKVLARFDADIARGEYGHVDSMLVIRHGKIAYERTYKRDYETIYASHARTRSALNAHDPSGPYNYFNPWWHPYYRRGDLHTMQSVTKSITSVVIGIATARGEFPSLDTPVLTYFDAAKIANVDERKRRMTLRHLLTMTAGIDWNEDLPYYDPNNSCSQMEASFDWVDFTINRPMATEPGTTFQYSSGATQLLSHVFRSATGRDIEEYAVQHLFAPLGITRHFWKRTPTGLADTQGGLYLTPRDVARIGYLYLSKGKWDGKQIVPAEWVAASIAPSISAGTRGTGIQYGYKWWLYPYGTEGRMAFAGSGLGGQRPIVIPELDLIIVFTAWNILPDTPSLTWRVAIDRVLEAVRDKKPLAKTGRLDP